MAKRDLFPLPPGANPDNYITADDFNNLPKLTTSAPGPLGLVSAAGASTDAARSDHVHSHPAIYVKTIADLRALAVPTVSFVHMRVTGYYADGDGGGGKFIWDSASTLADDGGLTIKPTAVAGGSPGRWRRVVVKGRVDPREFGAVGDGTSHPLSGYFGTLAAAQAIYPHATALTNEVDWAAWQAAINAVRAATTTGTYFALGGTVWGSKGVYLCDQPLEMHATLGMSIWGRGGTGSIGTGNTNGGAVQLIYTGSTAKRFIDCRSTGACTLEKLSLGYNNTAWYGDLVDVSHYNGGDTQGFTMRDCMLSGTTAINIVAGQGCRSLLFMGNAISSRVANCLFGVAKRAIKFREMDGSYANALTVEGCIFVYHDYSLVNAGESVQVNNCIFEGSGGQMRAAYYDEYADVQARPACTLTFDAAGQTITRSSGDWTAEGFQVGDTPSFFEFAADPVTGLPAVNTKQMGAITALTATVMTVASGVVDEVRHDDCIAYATSTTQGRASPSSLGASQGLTFTIDGTAKTITRSAGSWLTDNLLFVGLGLQMTGTASNNGTYSAIVGVSPDGTTLYFGANNFTFSGNTITRSDGRDFADDGWTAGMAVTVAGTTSNNGSSWTVTGVATNVLTVSGPAFTAETTSGTGDIYSLFETRLQARSVGSVGQALVTETTTAGHLYQSNVGGGPISFDGCWMGDQFLPFSWLNFGAASSVKISRCQMIGMLRIATFRQSITGLDIDGSTHISSIQEPLYFGGNATGINISANVSGVAAADIYPASQSPDHIDMNTPVTGGSPTAASNVIKKHAKSWALTTLAPAEIVNMTNATTYVNLAWIVSQGIGVAMGGDATAGHVQALGLLRLQWYSSHLSLCGFGFGNVGIGYGYNDTNLPNTPTSLLHVGGAIATSYRTTLDTNITALFSDSVIGINAATVDVTVTLPDATTCKGRTYTLVRLNAANHANNVATASSQTIGGVASPYTLGAPGHSIEIYSDGANWLIRAERKLGYLKITDSTVSVTTCSTIIGLNAATADTTATLPDATTCMGQKFTLKRLSAAAHANNVATVSAQTIDGAASPYVLPAQWSSVVVFSDGANWLIESKV